MPNEVWRADGDLAQGRVARYGGAGGEVAMRAARA